MTIHLEVWRQKNNQDTGRLEKYTLDTVSPDMSFLEMLDVLNEKLIKENIAPVEFDSDCREGICGMCSCMINGQAHGPQTGNATCQLHMRSFKDGDTVVVEPWRAKAFPVVKDLVVDRSAFDRIIMAGGYTSAKTGPHPDANTHLIPKDIADLAMDAATCIGCGACVGACPNASASLFTAAKVSQMALLPQGQAEAARRVVKMVERMDAEGFGNCTNIGECSSACPKEISIDFISKMKREYRKAILSGGDI
ncbi:succinate dehydrogenase/fumarate reductase iron-sulfur subunit [bacterium]|nr:succinate dehydrogenase/fumarate reductase iron-sulfur subunit [bacterium]